MWNSLVPAYYELTNSPNIVQIRFPAQFDGVIYDSDEFRMYGFKIKRCPRLRSHDWTQCPFAHRGERAARRDPCRFNYCAVPCPDFREIGACARGEACLFAHGVFEQWLHPERYRTRLCSAGLDCQRQVCFFAHTLGELRAEEPPNFDCHCMHQTLPEVSTEVRTKEILNVHVGTSPSLVSSPTFQATAAPAFLTSSLTAFTGGNDFLASLSGIRVKEKEKKPRSAFRGYAAEQHVPNISWVEEVVVE